MKKTPVLVAALIGLCVASAFAADDGLMRIIGPVRLSDEPGATLAGQITETRQILEKFQKGGFGQAIWAVDRLPAKDEDIKPWVAACLKAFPGEVIVALDTTLTNGAASPDPARLKVFLKALLQLSSTVNAEPGTPNPVSVNREPGTVNSLLVNYTRMDNWECVNNEAEAIAQTRANAELVRSMAPKTFVWLLMDDDPKSAGRIDSWSKGLGNLVNGYVLYRWHEWNAASDPNLTTSAQPLIKTGKPVLRGGFRYTAARPRPGIETDLQANFRKRMATYEQWITTNRFVGYMREIGQGIPGQMDPNRALAPE